MSRFTTFVRFLSLFSVALSLVLLSGCSGGGKGKPNQANFDAIKTGMTEKEVEELMGPPNGGDTGDLMKDKGKVGGIDLGGMMPKAKVWKDGNKTFSVTFGPDGKVLLFVAN